MGPFKPKPGVLYMVRVEWETPYQGFKKKHSTDTIPMTYEMALAFSKEVAKRPREAGAKVSIVEEGR